ncbi:MAG: tRNA(Ile)(2)-agmatinylcytidine synthase [Candidatus Thorarchaeota archaeon]
MTLERISIGMDDIDTPRGGCTTHFASLLVEKLEGLNVEWVDYPRLIRFNPNIPYRTRGNGGVALQFKILSGELDGLLENASMMIKEYIKESYPNTNPGFVIARDDPSDSIRNLSRLAGWRTVSISSAMKTIEKNSLDFYSEGNGRGLIGALGAIGNTLDADYTYEYIAYRSLEDTSEKRGVDSESVIEMDRAMEGSLFSNVDHKENRILIEPRGPDPVLFGIRGESARDVIEAAKHIRSKQEIDRWMVFRTNQGTGEHLTHRVGIDDLRPYMAAVVEGPVKSAPRIIEGGHVILIIGNESSHIDCAAYEPTGEFREIVQQLIVGDTVRVYAGVRPASRLHGLTLNIEGLEVISIDEKKSLANPVCPDCFKRMKSAGSQKGFKCVKCGFRDPEGVKVESVIERKIVQGLYLPPPRAQRHLTRPVERLTRNNSQTHLVLIEKWHNP